MKCIIYCRVSTKEQAETGYSLEGQEKECKKFAENSGYEVDRVFIERGESAKTQDRTELAKLLRYTVENKKNLSAVIIWKYDRLARNLSDQFELVKNLSLLNIRILSATENNEDTAIGRLMRNIIGSFAQFDNDVKSERTILGMRRAIEDGRWPWRAPLGYKQYRNGSSKSLLIPSEDSKFVVEAFRLAESGLYKQIEIADHLRKKGFKRATKGLVNRILTNPLYAGLIKVDWFPDYRKAIHRAIISEETFFKVQLLLQGKRPSITPRVRNHPDFPLRCFIRCPKCGQKLTGGWSTGRKKIKYAYYNCRTKGCSLNIRKQDLEGKFYEYLKSFEPNKEVLELFEATIADVWKSKQAQRIKEQLRLKRELKRLQERKDRVDELMIKGVFDEETYKQKSDEIKNEILVKQIELSEANIELNDIEACLNFCKFFLSNLADLWANADLGLKQRFQKLVFPAEIYYERETFRTTATALIFKHLQQKSPSEFPLAPPTGFEPVSPP